MTTKQVLSRARRTIQNPERWTKGELAKDRNGQPVMATAKSACQWCARGAVAKAAHNDWDAELAAVRALECGIKRIGSRASFVVTFNDSRYTNHERVLRAFDRALEECV